MNFSDSVDRVSDRMRRRYYQWKSDKLVELYRGKISECNLQAHYWKSDSRYHLDFRAAMANRWYSKSARFAAKLLEQKVLLWQKLNRQTKQSSGAGKCLL